MITELQADEIRTIIHDKEQPIWIFATIEVWSPLWPATVVGRRGYRNTLFIFRDIFRRTNLERVPLIATDGFAFYAKGMVTAGAAIATATAACIAGTDRAGSGNSLTAPDRHRRMTISRLTNDWYLRICDSVRGVARFWQILSHDKAFDFTLGDTAAPSRRA